MASFLDDPPEAGDPQARLAADQALLAQVRRDDFKGPGWERLACRLVGYGFRVVFGWVLTGRIIIECRRKRIRFTPQVLSVDAMSKDAAEELALETAAQALHAFRNKVLILDRWRPERGASLDSYFVGQCLWQFPTVYDRWMNEHRPRLEVSLEAAREQGLAEPADQGAGGDPEGLTILRMETNQALDEEVGNERTRQILVLHTEGYSHAEIGEVLKVTAKAVESALYRHRHRHRSSQPREEGDDE